MNSLLMALIAALTVSGPMFIIIGFILVPLLFFAAVLKRKECLSIRLWKVVLVISGFIVCGPILAFLGSCVFVFAFGRLGYT